MMLLMSCCASMETGQLAPEEVVQVHPGRMRHRIIPIAKWVESMRRGLVSSDCLRASGCFQRASSTSIGYT